MKNHLGQTVYRTFAGWKRAVKKIYPAAQFKRDDGPRDDAFNAVIYHVAKAQNVSVGYWNDTEGTVIAHAVTFAPPPVTLATVKEQIQEDILTRFDYLKDEEKTLLCQIVCDNFSKLPAM